MEYRLVKADRKMFSKYFATYYKNIGLDRAGVI